MTDEEKKKAHREAARRWREKNKEHVAAYNAAYYQKNKEALDEAHLEWRGENRDLYRKYSRNSMRKKRSEEKKEAPED